MTAQVYLILEYPYQKTKKAKAEFAKYKRALKKEGFYKRTSTVYYKYADFSAYDEEATDRYYKFIKSLQPAAGIGSTTMLVSPLCEYFVNSPKQDEMNNLLKNKDRTALNALLEQELTRD